VLAVLLLNVGQLVSVDDLARMLWGQERPAAARVTVQNYVKRLRKALGDADRSRISTHASGYSISVATSELDVSQFEMLAAAACVAIRDGSWERASQQAAEALSLWRGEPLADVGCDLLSAREVPRLAELRLQAQEAQLDAALHLGGHAEAVPELRRLSDAHPLRERLHMLLMLALYRSGRQGEALTAYQDARRVVIEELGTEPGRQLRDLHQQILTDAPDLGAPRPAAAKPAPAVLTAGEPASGAQPPARTTPRQLPVASAHLTGRTAELAALDAMLEGIDGQPPGSAAIVAIGGTAGVGKTTLAVHWSHRVAGHFGDGQLYVNLQGFTPSGSPVEPGEAIRGFLAALDVPTDRIPEDMAAQAALYRSLLADRKVLVVLDNARDEGQVRPLLPASPGCLALVTSRNLLTGLAAAEGAQLISLDVLSRAEACQFLAGRLGHRVAAEPQAVGQIADLCACLPLALAVAAARAAARPAFPLTALARELGGASRSRLDALDTGDPAVTVRGVFSWSYLGLSETGRRLFRLLGLHPGPDISGSAAASLTGRDPVATRRDLAELTRAHLLAEHRPGRYACHDLLHAYAAEQAAAVDADQARKAAIGRVLDHYLQAASVADHLLYPGRDPITIMPPWPGVTPEHLTEIQEALDWFKAENRGLLAAVPLAADNGFDACAWQLPWAMAEFLTRQGQWHEQIAVQTAAVAAAERLGDTGTEAALRRRQGMAYARLGDHEHARAHLDGSLALYRQLGDRVGEAYIHQGLGFIAQRGGQYQLALSHAEQCLRLLQAAGHRARLPDAFNNVGWSHALLGDGPQARVYCQQSIALHRELGNRRGEAVAWDSLGYAEHLLGCLADAVDCYQQALALIREVGDRFAEADFLIRLGDAHDAAGSPAQAREAWERALNIFDSLRPNDAGKARHRLFLLSSGASAHDGSSRAGDLGASRPPQEGAT
jgi:DNA-binding SARP family transcriptional activator